MFQRNVVDDVWMFQDVFDGGNWYVLGNHFKNMTA